MVRLYGSRARGGGGCGYGGFFSFRDLDAIESRMRAEGRVRKRERENSL